MMDDAPPAWSLIKALWKDRLLILVCALIGIVFAGFLVFRPQAPQFVSRVSLPAISLAVPYDTLFEEFQAYWERSEIGPGKMPGVSTEFGFNVGPRAIIITVRAAESETVADYIERLKADVAQFGEEYAVQANLQLRELTGVANAFPGASGSDYVASTAHRMRLILADVAGPGMFAVQPSAIIVESRSTASRLLTVVVGLFLGLMIGLLLAVGRMSWMQGADRARAV
jgi:hypothetical protein